MAISSTPSILSLDEFCGVMEISPWLFNQLDPTLLGSDTIYKVWYQQEGGQTASTIGRDTIANAIAGAEEMIAKELTYWPGRHVVVGEVIQYPHPFEPQWWNNWETERWFLKDVKTKWGYLTAVGVEAYTVIDPQSTITFVDEDGDGKYDTFTTAAIPTTLIDPSEIVASFADADRSRFVDGPESVWRIRPVRVDISGGFVTVSGPIWLVVDPDKVFRPAPSALDPTDIAANGSYVQRIKVSRLYVDDTQQGVLTFEQISALFPCSDLQPCEQAERTVCYSPRDKINGVVIPQMTDPTPLPWSLRSWQAPNRVTINYLSGYPPKQGGDGRMDVLYAQMVARLAATLLPDRAAASNSETQIDYWRNYPVDFTGKTLMLSQQDSNNPFGMRRGALWTWQRTMEMNERHLAGAIR